MAVFPRGMSRLVVAIDAIVAAVVFLGSFLALDVTTKVCGNKIKSFFFSADLLSTIPASSSADFFHHRVLLPSVRPHSKDVLDSGAQWLIAAVIELPSCRVAIVYGQKEGSASAVGLLRARYGDSPASPGFSAASGRRAACGRMVLMGPTQHGVEAAGPTWTTREAFVLPDFAMRRHVPSMQCWRSCFCSLEIKRPAAKGGGPVDHDARYFPHRQQIWFSYQSVHLFICRHGSGKAVIGARVDRQRQLMSVLRFGIGCCGSILLSPVKPSSYLRLKTTILEDTGRSDSRGERRLAYRSATMRTLDASIVATSRGFPSPDGPSAPDGSVAYVYIDKFAVAAFTCLCFVIWEHVFPFRCTVP